MKVSEFLYMPHTDLPFKDVDAIPHKPHSPSLMLRQKQPRSHCPCLRRHLIFLIGICEVQRENLLWSHLQRNAPVPRNYKAKIVSRRGRQQFYYSLKCSAMAFMGVWKSHLRSRSEEWAAWPWAHCVLSLSISTTLSLNNGQTSSLPPEANGFSWRRNQHRNTSTGNPPP